MKRIIHHKKSNSLLLRVQDPASITNYIPRSRVVDFKGSPVVQVHFGQDEVKVLRNLGIPAPAPIAYNYKWSGKFTPYVHQVASASEFTLYQRFICLDEMGCVDATTEYLSPTGWRRIDQYKGGPVAQYWPETGAVEFVEPTEYVRKPCPEMIRFKTSRGVDQLLSPEHRVLYVGSTGKTHVVQAEAVEAAHHAAAKGWKGRFITTFTPDAGRPGLLLSADALRLQVAVAADGHFPNKTGRAVLRLKKPRKVARLRQLLRATNTPWKESDQPSTGFTIFTFAAPVRTKEFGAQFWDATQAQLQVIADECVHWDGSGRKADAVAFFSTSKASADFIQYAFSATGRTATIGRDRRPGRTTCYIVHAQNKAALRYLCGVTDAGEKTNTVWREPSPDGHKYCFMVPSTFLLLRRNGNIFATGNTGKTLSSLWAADYLMDQGLIRKALIVSTRSTMSAVWENEIMTHFMFNRKCSVLSGSKERRLRKLAEDVDFYIINHDGLKVLHKELALRKDIDLLIVDEAAAFRTHTTDRHKALAGLVTPERWLWLMTGTPCPTQPTDAWALARLLGSKTCPQYFRTFKNEVMVQVTSFKWVPKPNATKRVYEVLQPGIRHLKKDCVDLPPVTFLRRSCELSKDQAKHYKTMREHLVMQAKAATSPITAANAAVRMQKLLQICAGAVYDNDGNAQTIDCTPRLAVLQELCEEATNKVIVFVPFTAALHQVAKFLRKTWTVEVVNGAVGDKERERIFREFQHAKDPRILVAHPGVAAHGLTLTAADTTIWFAPLYSLEIFEQANNRMDRPGQKSPMTVAMISSTPLEDGVYAALQQRAKVQDAVLSLYRRAIA